MNGYTRELARFISETSYSDLSGNLRVCMRKYFLDAVGCGLYGTTTESGRITVSLRPRAGWKRGSHALEKQLVRAGGARGALPRYLDARVRTR